MRTINYEFCALFGICSFIVLMLLCLMSGIVVILCNMAAQIINERIDPRMREKEAAETSEVMML